VQCRFFLTFAYLIINGVPTKAGEKRNGTSWKNDVIAPWFQTMEEFHELYTTADFNFGYTLKEKQKDDVKHGRFLHFKVPDVYCPLLEQKAKLKNESGILAFVSLLDFCLSLESINFKHDKNAVSLSGMGVSIPSEKAKLTAFLKGMRLCIFQVIDRIASTQLGSSREEAAEYQKFIIPTNKDHKEIKMPQPRHRFPDLCRGGNSWKPLTVVVPMAAGLDSLVALESDIVESEEEMESNSQQVRETIPRKRKAKHNSTGRNSGKQGNVQVTVATDVQKSLTTNNEYRKNKSFPESSRENSQPKETVQVTLDAGLEYLVDTDSEMVHEDEVELESEQNRKMLPRKPRRRNSKSQTTPLRRVQTLRKQSRGITLDASNTPLPPTDKFIGRISTPTIEKTQKETRKRKGKKTLPPRDTCNNEETVGGSEAVADLSIEGRSHNTVVTGVGYPSVMDIAPLARICAEDFRRSTSEHAKEDVMWTVFRMLHDKNRFPLVVDAMTSIRQSLEQESPVVIRELGNMDLCRGNKPPRSYLKRTFEFATQYGKLMGTDKKKNLLKNIVMTLRKEGFRFVEEKQTHGGWQEMSIESAIDVVRRRMQRLAQDKSENSKEKLQKLETPPGPFVQLDGAPAGRAIVCGKNNKAKGNPYNAAYRTKISEVASEFKNASPDGKKGITLRLLEDLEKEEYTFVHKDKDGVWKQMPREKIVEKVRKSLIEYEKPRAKRKAAEMSTSDVDKEEQTDKEVRNEDEEEKANT
jgi:hypothetical protein